MKERTKLGLATSLHLALFSVAASTAANAAAALGFGVGSAIVLTGSLYHELFWKL